MATLQKTSDYSIFMSSDINRDIGRTKVLEASMKKHGFIEARPLHVMHTKNGLEIKDGHHRFNVAASLGLPVLYIVSNDSASISELVLSTNNWSMDDYLHSNARNGNKNYIAVRDYKERTGINTSQCVSMLGGELASSSNKSNSFKSGTYKICDNFYHAETVADLVEVLQLYGVYWANTSSVVASLSRIVAGGHADIEQFKQKIKSNASLITKKQNISLYADLWQEIYNRNTKGQRLQLTFLTNETIKDRQLFANKI